MKTKYPCISLVPELVLATMKGEKTQTRRKVKAPLEYDKCFIGTDLNGQVNAAFYDSDYGYERIEFPQYQPGQILWVRESAAPFYLSRDHKTNLYEVKLRYVADNIESNWIIWPERLTASPFLGKCIPNGIFKEAARTFVKITDVRVERLQDISEEDAIREGIVECYISADDYFPTDRKGYMVYPDDGGSGLDASPITTFKNLWQSIYGIESWNSNPYVFAYSYELTERPHDFLTSK